MPTATFEYRADAARVAIEQAIAFAAAMPTLAQSAPAGQVLAPCEGPALDQGRRLLPTTGEQAVPARVPGTARPASAKR